VGTPIGNLEDMTYRAVRVLGAVSLVAAEDTRAAAVLLGHYGLRTPVVSCFEGNEATRAAQLVPRLVAGESMAVISQAGMPLVSDPGGRMVAAALAAGLPVEVVPGPSAPIAALAVAGLPSAHFAMHGFLPRAAGERAALLARLRDDQSTQLFFESPHRTGKTLRELAASWGGERRGAVARELTKVHEEVVRGTLSELAARYEASAPRGEVTLVIEGASAERLGAVRAGDEALRSEVVRRLAAGDGAKQIAAELSEALGLPRRVVYQLALELSR
jgi:16S rRNA (cytidine1402-2'-O)-methyltransferase